MQVAKDIVGQILICDTVSLDMVDLRTFDDYTYRHSVNVAVLSTIIGMGMGLGQEELNDFCVGAIFHDIIIRQRDCAAVQRGRCGRLYRKTVSANISAG